MRVYIGRQERVVYEPLSMGVRSMGKPPARSAQPRRGVKIRRRSGFLPALAQSRPASPPARSTALGSTGAGYTVDPLKIPPLLAVVLGLILLSAGFFDAAFLRSPPADRLVFTGTEVAEVPVHKASLESRPPSTRIPNAVFTRHRVARGETLSRIAYQYGLSPLTLISVNRLERPNDIKPGALLIVPYRDGVRLKARSGESVAEAAGRIGTETESIQILPGGDLFVSGIEVSRQIPPALAHDMFLYPVAGRVVTAFGSGVDELTGVPYESEGIDMSVKKGTPVVASRDGKVILTGRHPSYGLYVIMSHSGQWRSFYGHLGRVDVAPGDDLKAGTPLGIARSPRLHFVLIRNGEVVDPLDHLY